MFKTFFKWFRSKKKDTVFSQKQVAQESPPTSSDDAEQNQVVPYDENLLECSRTQWQFGDWESLAQLERATLQHHPDRAKLALLAGAGHLQLGNMPAARQFIRVAQDWGCSKKMINQVLIAGVHNTLGKAAAMAGQEQRALAHFEDGVRIANSGGDVRLLTQARVRQQLGELASTSSICFRLESDHGPAKLWQLAQELQEQNCVTEADTVLRKAVQQQPDNPVLLEALAENAMQLQNYTEAARRWQDVAVVLGPDTPQRIYNRMSDAYALVSSDWGGTEEENYCYGDRHKHDILSELHQKLQPKFYLEIGVDEGLSLSLAQCQAIGIDPRPQLNLQKPLQKNAQIITASSDAFFRDQASEYLKTSPDIVFIDGMHLFEFALLDFMNVECFASPSTLVVIDDVHPCHPTQALRQRRSNSWTGDIWKLHAILSEYRPDLHIVDINASTTGLLLIWGLDSKSSVLHDHYNAIVDKYKRNDTVPDAVLSREGVLPSVNGVQKVIDALQETRA